METNTQGTSDKPVVTQGKTTWGFLTAVLGLLVVGLAAGLFIFGPQISAEGTLASGTTPTEAGAVPSLTDPTAGSAQVTTRVYEAFECPCCGKDIGSCSCGMAEERRGFIDEQVAQGATQSQVYRAMLQRYGTEAFFDRALASQVRTDLLAELPAERPVLVVEPSELDLGMVSISDRQISASFAVRNAGQSDLTITGMETTCGCTTAVLETSEGTSPVFGGGPTEDRSDWSAVLAPGEEALLVATFDLMFHGPDATGRFQRGISVISDDPLNSRIGVSLVVEVTK
ncbi:MAG: hypothetical protein CEE40_07990 [Chloroflexi bacterium B3_Chlor]|nr:MAG: hypothetical protein CEE40_07990 [Chloroflexi bacterium B3_Chlor]